MIRHGVAPFLECSSRGDKRLSAFYARPKSLNGRSIEDAYQGMKVFEDNGELVTGLTWQQAKGRHAMNAEDCAVAYERWWREWVGQEHLEQVLMDAWGLSDIFGQVGHVCQATTLWKIRGELVGEPND